MLKVAIIGLGTVSVIHKSAIEMSTKAKLVAVCDINPDKKEGYSVPFYTSIEEMLEKEDIDCVHICLPHYLHVPIIKLCAEYKVHIFTEKPVALDYVQALELFEIEEKFDIKVGVCLQNRYNKTILKLKSLLVINDFGKFLGSKGIVTWNRTMDYYNEAEWRGKKELAGGGVIINQAIHTLDLLSYVIGDFKSVEGKIGNFSLKETEIEDSVMCRMEYINSGSALFFATISYAVNSSVELEFVFEKATFLIKDSKLYKIYENDREYICEDQKLQGTKHYYGASHIDAINKFHLAILNDNKDYISVVEASKSIKTMDKIFDSSMSNSVKEIV